MYWSDNWFGSLKVSFLRHSDQHQWKPSGCRRRIDASLPSGRHSSFGPAVHAARPLCSALSSISQPLTHALGPMTWGDSAQTESGIPTPTGSCSSPTYHERYQEDTAISLQRKAAWNRGHHSFFTEQKGQTNKKMQQSRKIPKLPYSVIKNKNKILPYLKVEMDK